MQIAVEVSNFERNAVAFAVAADRELVDVLTQEARLFAKNVIQRTPPFVSMSGLESFAVQRRAGEEAVKRDVERAFAPVDTLPEKFTRSPRLKRQMERAIEARDIDRVRGLFVVAKIPSSSLVQAPTEALHNSVRDRRGRVRRSRTSYYVMDGRALQRFVRQKQKLVGRAKAGWVAGARALQVRGLPQWIQRHPEQGIVIDQLRTDWSADPYITLRNTVSYIDTLERNVQMVPQALRGRSIAMEARVKAKMRGLWGRRARQRAA